ncbi:hypothetical protein JL475_21040 [Streptomyces sp. M2CJ-2]|uniref:hypothetical protein n=1 Tax=Streptomyces sp. M2CJ-2 TaxID=2803948 RepID=UPI001926035A|nr:hypothetical protein [Streptomyces sp. M2CJ-2]MBL3668433.1 hypothetical protein [Streptomyces sp. M2CJ-2]
MGDWDIIRAELDAAEREQRTISDLAARVIATQFYGGQSSALYALSSTGTITDGWDSEIHTATTHSHEYRERRALEALAAYCKRRPDKGRRPNWSALRW